MNARARDALVAENVMGWVDVCVDVDGEYYGYPPSADTSLGCDRVPRYTTDISAAWGAIDKMKHTDPWEYGRVHLRWGGYGNTLTPKGPHGQMMYPNELSWECSIETEASGGTGVALTAPEAICLAALRAVGVDVK
jgi:hypothetical protein